MSKVIISTDKAPAAIGTYSQAVKIGTTVYLSGQIPLVPETMQMVSENFAEQNVCIKLSLYESKMTATTVPETSKADIVLKKLRLARGDRLGPGIAHSEHRKLIGSLHRKQPRFGSGIASEPIVAIKVIVTRIRTH